MKSKNIKAFPKTSVNQYGELLSEHNEGMDLRDYFAGKYLQGLLSSEYYAGINTDKKNVLNIAKTAYLFADAMIEVRSLKTES